jgi:hypothetical protein
MPACSNERISESIVPPCPNTPSTATSTIIIGNSDSTP